MSVLQCVLWFVCVSVCVSLFVIFVASVTSIWLSCGEQENE